MQKVPQSSSKMAAKHNGSTVKKLTRLNFYTSIALAVVIILADLRCSGFIDMQVKQADERRGGLVTAIH